MIDSSDSKKGPNIKGLELRASRIPKSKQFLHASPSENRAAWLGHSRADRARTSRLPSQLRRSVDKAGKAPGPREFQSG